MKTINNIFQKTKEIKNTFLLTRDEKKPCPQCNHKMFWNQTEHSEHSYIARFDCPHCKHFEYRGETWSHYFYEKIEVKRAFLVKHGIFQIVNRIDSYRKYVPEYSVVPKITEHAKERLFECLFSQLTKNHVTQVDFVFNGFVGINNMTNEQLVQKMLDNNIDPYN